jgi:hypothetical protein
MSSCAAKPSPPMSSRAKLPRPRPGVVARDDTAGCRRRRVSLRGGHHQDQVLILLSTRTQPREQRISHLVPPSGLPQCAHHGQPLLAQRTLDHRGRRPPAAPQRPAEHTVRHRAVLTRNRKPDRVTTAAATIPLRPRKASFAGLPLMTAVVISHLKKKMTHHTADTK